MARKTNAERDAELLQTARTKFNRIMSATRDDREMALADRRFLRVPGAQWEDGYRQQFVNKPRLEFNRAAGAANRLEADHRANRVTVRFLPKDGSPTDANADAIAGRFRADWQDSNADEAADNAFSELIAGGCGALEVRQDVEDEEGDETELRLFIEPVHDADVSVYWPSDAKKQNKSDAEECFKRYSVDRDTYRERWGDDPSSWTPLGNGLSYGLDWYTPDIVYLVEWYRIERKKETYYCFAPAIEGGEEIEVTEDDLLEMVDVNGEEIEDYDEEETYDAPPMTRRAWLEATGHTQKGEAKTRKVKRVRKVTLSGGKVLIPPRYIAGKCIPIAPGYGIRSFVENKERYEGIVRNIKDGQRLFNMQMSKLAEISALSVVKKPVFDPDEIDEFAVDWSRANIDDAPYLRRRTMLTSDGAPIVKPLEYTQTPDVPAPMAALIGLTSDVMKEMLGDHQQAEKIQPNTSGKAVEMMQTAIDRMTAIYLDNFAQCIKRVGEIWLSMARDVYHQKGRKLKTIGADMKSRGSIVLGEPTVNEAGKVLRAGEVDFSKAAYDVVVDVGPSSVTRKAATVKALTQLLAITPANDQRMQTALMSVIGANLSDLEGVGEFADWSRMEAVRAGVLKPTEQESMTLQKEAQAKAGAPPDAQTKLLDAATAKEQALGQKAQLDALKAGAQTELAQAQIKKTDAETLRTLSETHKAANAPPEPPPSFQPPPKR